MRENFLKIQLTLSDSYFSLDDIWRDLGSRRDCSHRMHVSLALLVSQQACQPHSKRGWASRLVALDWFTNHKPSTATPIIKDCNWLEIVEQDIIEMPSKKTPASVMIIDNILALFLDI